jgi:uncharacterized coiled-coil DUF342 family protein
VRSWSEQSFASSPLSGERWTGFVGKLDACESQLKSSGETERIALDGIMASLKKLATEQGSYHTGQLELRRTLITCVSSVRKLTDMLNELSRQEQSLVEECGRIREELAQTLAETDRMTEEFNAMKRQYLALCARLASSGV